MMLASSGRTEQNSRFISNPWQGLPSEAPRALPGEALQLPCGCTCATVLWIILGVVSVTLPYVREAYSTFDDAGTARVTCRDVGVRISTPKPIRQEPEKVKVEAKKETEAAIAHADVPCCPIKVLPETIIHGGDYQGSRLHEKTLEACQEACKADIVCLAYTHNAQMMRCWLKNSQAGHKTQRKGFESGLLTRGPLQPPAPPTAEEDLYDVWTKMYGLDDEDPPEEVVPPPDWAGTGSSYPFARHLEECVRNEKLWTQQEERGPDGEDPSWLRREGDRDFGSRPPWILGADEDNLGGTRYTQAKIWALQFPKRCDDPANRYTIAGWEGINGHGIGSQLHVMCQMWAVAFEHNRILVPQRGTFERASHDGCKEGKRGSLDCYFFPMVNSTCAEYAHKTWEASERAGGQVGRKPVHDRNLWHRIGSTFSRSGSGNAESQLVAFSMHSFYAAPSATLYLPRDKQNPSPKVWAHGCR
eukprot:TRINITY_DN15717_c0_g2_i1.p1 TRINITY_DN15717_c0_g2~~TRINITY_DN15717_c0_g2_i1.p1  ORF type:complete len:473 (-),score=43.06 TRINITY_DN15717_c0_g2_i1:1349-2767(-)